MVKLKLTNLMIIPFGGASSITKTTLSQSFSSDSHLITPEINLLFENEKREGKFYFSPTRSVFDSQFN